MKGRGSKNKEFGKPKKSMGWLGELGAEESRLKRHREKEKREGGKAGESIREQTNITGPSKGKPHQPLNPSAGGTDQQKGGVRKLPVKGKK